MDDRHLRETSIADDQFLRHTDHQGDYNGNYNYYYFYYFYKNYYYYHNCLWMISSLYWMITLITNGTPTTTQGCINCAILPSGMGTRGVSSEHVENKEMFSCSPT